MLGLAPEDISIDLNNNMLSISGEVKPFEERYVSPSIDAHMKEGKIEKISHPSMNIGFFNIPRNWGCMQG